MKSINILDYLILSDVYTKNNEKLKLLAELTKKELEKICNEIEIYPRNCGHNSAKMLIYISWPNIYSWIFGLNENNELIFRGSNLDKTGNYSYEDRPYQKTIEEAKEELKKLHNDFIMQDIFKQ